MDKLGWVAGSLLGWGQGHGHRSKLRLLVSCHLDSNRSVPEAVQEVWHSSRPLLRESKKEQSKGCTYCLSCRFRSHTVLFFQPPCWVHSPPQGYVCMNTSTQELCGATLEHSTGTLSFLNSFYHSRWHEYGHLVALTTWQYTPVIPSLQGLWPQEHKVYSMQWKCLSQKQTLTWEYQDESRGWGFGLWEHRVLSHVTSGMVEFCAWVHWMCPREEPSGSPLLVGVSAGIRVADGQSDKVLHSPQGHS